MQKDQEFVPEAVAGADATSPIITHAFESRTSQEAREESSVGNKDDKSELSKEMKDEDRGESEDQDSEHGYDDEEKYASPDKLPQTGKYISITQSSSPFQIVNSKGETVYEKPSPQRSDSLEGSSDEEKTVKHDTEECVLSSQASIEAGET